MYDPVDIKPVPLPPARGSYASKPQREWMRLALLGLLMAFASISTDFYLPALPTMTSALHSDQGTLALTVSGYLGGFSVGQLLWGPLGDRYGRRVPVAIGLVLFVIGSAGCATSASASALIAWRVVQAVGACASVVLARAMVRDLYVEGRAARVLSHLMTVMAVAPLIGPLVGGQVLVLAGWRSIFWTLVAIGFATLACVLSQPETLPPTGRNAEPLTRALATYIGLLREPRLLAYAGVCGFFYAGSFAYVAGSPFAYIAYHHVPPDLYGLLFGIGIVGIMGANLVNAQLVGRAGGDRLIVIGTCAAAVSGLVLAFTAWTGWGGVAGLAVPLFVFVSGTGFIVANAITGALDENPHRAGTVSALVGAIQYGGGIFGSALVGLLADGTPWPMGLVVALAGVGSVACAIRIAAVRAKPPSPSEADPGALRDERPSPLR